MPAFPGYSEILAKGLAAQHGFPLDITTEIKAKKADIDQLKAAVTPLCNSCHGIGKKKALAVFGPGGQGINLKISGERLRHGYFLRWMIKPNRIDPISRMPPLPYTKKQLDAIYKFIESIKE